ncbi:GNAT family N-acetyltransferase [Litoreibacter roseus]|uniref:N-acetyltransferase n=1 Tax=Litoreibacter roseus TaxID=2601869 RepID=A0A6N6JG37_9RHOB|nr:N-acetyltransferase [Litoreibacter roseus]GFE65313.1 N-acetyltransferase [Litoreibacter roseus]
MRLKQETPDDWWEVEALFDLCFAPGRTALSSYRLRDNTEPLRALSTIARDAQNTLAGAIRFWPVKVGNHDALLLGPIAVHPTHQGEGLGAALIEDGLSSAKSAGWKRTLLVGDAPYYQKFGFEILPHVVMPPPTNPDRVLGAGAWTGVAGPVTPWPEKTGGQT